MKVYWLSPADGQPLLSPPQVVDRWRAAFPAVAADAEAARVFGERFIAKYRQLLAAGQGHNPTPLEEVQRRWAGALAVEVRGEADGPVQFRTVVCTEYRLQLEFGREVSPRRRRGRAAAAAKALGYRVVSLDGD
jgi:hypothetical protein